MNQTDNGNGVSCVQTTDNPQAVEVNVNAYPQLLGASVYYCLMSLLTNLATNSHMNYSDM